MDRLRASGGTRVRDTRPDYRSAAQILCGCVNMPQMVHVGRGSHLLEGRRCGEGRDCVT